MSKRKAGRLIMLQCITNIASSLGGSSKEMPKKVNGKENKTTTNSKHNMVKAVPGATFSK